MALLFNNQLIHALTLSPSKQMVLVFKIFLYPVVAVKYSICGIEQTVIPIKRQDKHFERPQASCNCISNDNTRFPTLFSL